MSEPALSHLEADAEPFVDLVTTARRLGELRWVERRLFEVVGAWVPATPEGAAKAAFATCSLHHAWHAELLGTVLPTLPNVDGISPEGVTRAPGAEGSHLTALMFEAEAADSTAARVERLRGSALPLLLAGYREHLALLSPVGDEPIRRVLRLVLDDVSTDLDNLKLLG